MSARGKKRNPWILLCSVAWCVFLVTWISIFVIHPNIPTRVGVAIIGDPTIVFSYDPQRSSIIGIRIPSDVYVDVTRGYGTYPLSSVWKLDTIDKRQGVVYTETLEEAIGIPIRFYIESPRKTEETDLREDIGNALSLSSFLRTIVDKRKTTIPPWLFIQMNRALRSMPPSDMVFFDLTYQGVFEDSMLADGTPVKKIDPGSLTFLLGTHAEDAQIRKENLRIAVFNTTASSGLAQKVTRIMEGLGFHVGSIANDETIQPSACIIKSNKDIQQTNSVQTLRWLYGCAVEDEVQDSQSDVSFIIGTDFEKRFFPY